MRVGKMLDAIFIIILLFSPCMRVYCSILLQSQREKKFIDFFVIDTIRIKSLNLSYATAMNGGDDGTTR